MAHFAILSVYATGGEMTSAALDAPPYLKTEVLNKYRARTPQSATPKQEQQSTGEISALVFDQEQCTRLSTSLLLQWCSERQGWTLKSGSSSMTDTGGEKTMFVLTTAAEPVVPEVV
jgi:hypothetical protein